VGPDARQGRWRIASVLLVFERLHWPEAQEVLAERASRHTVEASS
jgi:hypothetical protein